MLCQSADLARHGRDHAAGRPQGAGAYRGRIQPRPDAEQDLLKDGVGLVNIVRNAEQEDILRKLGAKHVVDSSQPTFMDDLINALVETGATLAFDAIGGGRLAGQILTCMETAANKTAKIYSRYGSSVHKQVYIYGGLDTRPTELIRSFGMAWGIGGWLLFPFLQKIGPAEARGCASAWSTSSRPPSPAITRRRCRYGKRCSCRISPATASARRARISDQSEQGRLKGVRFRAA